MFNNAGIAYASPISDVTHGDWRWVIDVDLWGPIHGVEAFLPRMIEQGGDRHILFTSSFAGMVGNAGLGPYCVAKFGVVALAESLSRELKGQGIGVSVLCPMILDTPIMTNSERTRSGDYGARTNQTDEAVQGLAAMITPTDEDVRPDDVARLTADAVVANRLYILPHSASRESIRRRFERIDRTYDEQAAEGWSSLSRPKPASPRSPEWLHGTVQRENGVGREATQRHGRHVAVQRDPQPAYAHLEGGGHRRHGLSTATSVSRCSVGRSSAACTCSTRCATASSTSRGSCTIRCGWRTARSTSTTTCAGCRYPSPGGRRELDQVIGEIASTPLDRDRPLWEFHFAEGMADDRFASIGKVHHTLADGVASANLLARLMDLTGSEQDERDDYTTREPPSRSELLRIAGHDHVQQHRGAAGPDPRRRAGFHPSPTPVAGAQRSAGHGQDVQVPADVRQSRRLARADVRDGVAVTGRGQGDGQAPRRDVQRHRAGDGGRRTARTVAALRRSGGPADHGVRAGGHRQVAGPHHRQRDQRTAGFAAGAHRRSARAGAADGHGRVARQGGQRAARPETARTADGVSATRRSRPPCSAGRPNAPRTAPS